MKYLIALFFGLLVGAAIFVIGVIYNPFNSDNGLSPLSVTDSEVIALNFSAVPSEAIVFTNDGDSHVKPFPEKVQQLWEAPIRSSSITATVMRDARGRTAGLGIKFSSESERTRLMKGEAMIDSAWYIYLPGSGSLFIEQFENHWAFLRDVIIPAYRSSADSWKGAWLGDLTAGPGALRTAAVTGGAGSLRGLKMEAVESLSAQAYSVEGGPVAAEGRLLIELPRDTEASESASSGE
ncbi:MAG: hypothetical protein KJO01_11605 [Gammaproteobacteria bacterium]|nr:hypothetical protein [Gammaproteobacteria bacterium]MBT8111299.1 hypothetical protein [Gammaproteobacteria bacterium]NND46058.1 hypothetical protein [Woeseiaceae bacterium]NNL45997.1 hypothetical protein [Woeseiaceae bacterium]